MEALQVCVQTAMRLLLQRLAAAHDGGVDVASGKVVVPVHKLSKFCRAVRDELEEEVSVIGPAFVTFWRPGGAVSALALAKGAAQVAVESIRGHPTDEFLLRTMIELRTMEDACVELGVCSADELGLDAGVTAAVEEWLDRQMNNVAEMVQNIKSSDNFKHPEPGSFISKSVVDLGSVVHAFLDPFIHAGVPGDDSALIVPAARRRPA